MKTDIVCDDEYEAQKLMSLIFIKEDKRKDVVMLTFQLVIRSLILFYKQHMIQKTSWAKLFEIKCFGLNVFFFHCCFVF